MSVFFSYNDLVIILVECHEHDFIFKSARYVYGN